MIGLLALAAVVTVDAGGIVALPLPKDASHPRHLGEPTLVVAGHAIVGVAADAEPGSRYVAVTTPEGERQLRFEVVAKKYPEQRLTIANQRMVDPLPKDLERIGRERDIQLAVYAQHTPVRDDLAPFAQPVDGIVSSPFGFRRVLNGKPRARHSGLDIAADTGTPVRAPAPATVAAVGDYFFNGKTVLLDHGGGLVTMYCHLDRINVAEGAAVARGDVIAAVGATGRVTGPHLHWTVSINEVRVDPVSVMAVFNALADADPAGGE